MSKTGDINDFERERGEIKNTCHSQKFLLGISRIRFRKGMFGYLLDTGKEQMGDPRQYASGMTTNRITSHGFTLIEILVVVLIIGILAAIALPQYQMTVEKSRAMEAVNMIDVLKKNMDLYIMEHGLRNVSFVGKHNNYPQADMYIDVLGSLDCSEGRSWCKGTHHSYEAYCNSRECTIYTERWLNDDEVYGFGLEWTPSEIIEKHCAYEGEKAEKICNSLRGMGWDLFEL